MNKDEIKKALECCTRLQEMEDCTKCSYYHTKACYDTLCEDALNLINEQEEEIERLKAVLENEKKQAVKEFAEKLIEYAYYSGYCQQVVDCYDIDELLKEYEK